jgi:hypothetical protein
MLTSDEFADKTCLIIRQHVGAVLCEKPCTLTADQISWFADHCDQRFRYLHALNPAWAKWLEGRDRKIDPRDQVKVWIRHWLSAYVQGPETYQEKHQ